MRVRHRLTTLATIAATVAVAGLVAGAVSPGSASATASPRTASAKSATGRTASAVGAGGYVPVSAARLLDTRIGLGAPKGAVAAHATVTLAVAGRGGIPSTGASAVVLNVTVATPQELGYITAYPAGTARPLASNLSFAQGETRPIEVVAPLGTGGAVNLYNGSTGATELIADVAGYYVAGSAVANGAFTPITPTRMLDTRTGNGAPEHRVTTYPNATTSSTDGTEIPVQVDGRGTIPSGGVSAVVVNLTVTNATGGGHLSVGASGTQYPGLVSFNSALSFHAGHTVSNLAYVPVGTDGRIAIFDVMNGGQSNDVIADVVGYFRGGAPAATGMYDPLTDSRTIDTRFDAPEYQKLTARSTLTVPATGNGGVPTTGVSAVAINVTATQSTAGGHLIVYAGGQTRPATSNLNFVTNTTTANLVVTPVGAGGTVDIYNDSTSTVQVLIDVTGYVGTLPGPLSWSNPQPALPPQGGLTSLSCPTTTFCAALDASGNVLTYDGSSWSAPQERHLSAVTCVSSTFCLGTSSISTADQVAVLATYSIYNGSSWTDPQVVDDAWATVQTVSCPSASFCLARGSNGTFDQFNGTAWTKAPSTPLSTKGPAGLSCPSDGLCVALDDQGNTSTLRSGAWSAAKKVAPSTSSASGYAVSCPTATFCAAVGAGGAALTDNGNSWTSVSTVDGGTDLTAVSCGSPSACVAVGSTGRVVVYNGSTWTANASVPDIAAVSCPSAARCFVTETKGAGRVRIFDTTFSAPTAIDVSTTDPDLISCASASFCVAASDRNAASQGVSVYDGTSWSEPESVDTAGINALSCPTTTFCVETDDAGQVATYDGSTWTTPAEVIAGVGLGPVSCGSASLCMAFGEQALYRYDGSSWQQVAIDEYTSISHVECATATLCLAIDDQGRALRFDGTSWGPPTDIGLSGSTSTLACSTSACVAASVVTGSTPAHTATYAAVFANGEWGSAKIVSAALGDLPTVACASGDACYAVVGQNAPPDNVAGYHEALSVWDGSAWGQPAGLDAVTAITAIDCPTSSFCAALDQNGSVILGS